MLTGTMQLVPLEQLLRLLQVLEPYVQEGRTRLISPDDEVVPCTGMQPTLPYNVTVTH